MPTHRRGCCGGETPGRGGGRAGPRPGDWGGGTTARGGGGCGRLAAAWAVEKVAIRRHQAGANGQAVVEGVLLVPKRIEPSDRPGFEIGNGENIAEIRGTEQRPMGDETVGVKFASLPSHELVEVEVELRLKDS